MRAVGALRRTHWLVWVAQELGRLISHRKISSLFSPGSGSVELWNSAIKSTGKSIYRRTRTVDVGHTNVGFNLQDRPALKRAGLGAKK